MLRAQKQVPTRFFLVLVTTRTYFQNFITQHIQQKYGITRRYCAIIIFHGSGYQVLGPQASQKFCHWEQTQKDSICKIGSAFQVCLNVRIYHALDLATF